MNRAEITEIFAVLMLAYPNAEMFKAPDREALKAKLAPVVTLWTTCLRDIDFWTAQRAVVKVCQGCKFPPTIAEMREAADAVTLETRQEIETAYMMARNEFRCVSAGVESAEDAMGRLPVRTLKVIEAMGGLDAFMPPDKPCFNMGGFEQTYERLLRNNPVGLPGEAGGRKALE